MCILTIQKRSRFEPGPPSPLFVATPVHLIKKSGNKCPNQGSSEKIGELGCRETGSREMLECREMLKGLSATEAC